MADGPQLAGCAAGAAELRPEEGSVLQEPGSGVRATVDGQEVAVGSRAFVCRHGASHSQADEGMHAPWERGAAGGDAGSIGASATRVWVAVGGRLAGVLDLADAVRPDAAAAVAALHRAGMRVLLVSGALLHGAELGARVAWPGSSVFLDVRAPFATRKLSHSAQAVS